MESLGLWHNFPTFKGDGDGTGLRRSRLLRLQVIEFWCRVMCLEAAEGLRGGAGRRQLRDQGLLVFGGSRGPRLMTLRLPRWDRLQEKVIGKETSKCGGIIHAPRTGSDKIWSSRFLRFRSSWHCAEFLQCK
ncbi:hypothetical protein EYF80_017039 [Liparis tanakae]|uniref:Uncharacterized protein n=1 Tax=Liparis tanakae TaxID=230148 RepID=A0A4Z2I5M0_9TELE|nr:hypothetical protein EYF80_017039 [Liparis tanakae]